MRKNADLERRLAAVAALQKLKTRASQADFAGAQARRRDAEAERTAADREFDGGMREMDELLTAEKLDFDRWRIGRAILEELAVARDTAMEEASLRMDEETNAQKAFGREKARGDRAATIHRGLVRRLGEKRDEAAAFEANGLTLVRKLVRQL